MIWMVLSREPTATVRLVGRVTSDHSAGESKTSLGSSDAVAVASTTAGGAGNWLDLSVEVCKVDAGDADHCSWDDAAFFAETPQTPSLPPPPPPPPRGGGGGGGGGGEGGEQPLQGTVAEQRVGGEEEGGRGGQVGHLRWYTKQIQWCLEGSFDNDQDDLHHELKSKEPFAHYFLKKNERISETACYGKQVSFILDQV